MHVLSLSHRAASKKKLANLQTWVNHASAPMHVQVHDGIDAEMRLNACRHLAAQRGIDVKDSAALAAFLDTHPSLFQHLSFDHETKREEDAQEDEPQWPPLSQVTGYRKGGYGLFSTASTDLAGKAAVLCIVASYERMLRNALAHAQTRGAKFIMLLEDDADLHRAVCPTTESWWDAISALVAMDATTWDVCQLAPSSKADYGILPWGDAPSGQWLRTHMAVGGMGWVLPVPPPGVPCPYLEALRAALRGPVCGCADNVQLPLQAKGRGLVPPAVLLQSYADTVDPESGAPCSTSLTVGKPMNYDAALRVGRARVFTATEQDSLEIQQLVRERAVQPPQVNEARVVVDAGVWAAWKAAMQRWGGMCMVQDARRILTDAKCIDAP